MKRTVGLNQLFFGETARNKQSVLQLFSLDSTASSAP